MIIWTVGVVIRLNNAPVQKVLFRRERGFMSNNVYNISEIFIRCDINRRTLKDSGRNSMMSITTQRDLALNDVNASAHLQWSNMFFSTVGKLRGGE